MVKKYYLKKDPEYNKNQQKNKPLVKISGLILLVLGLCIISYYTAPILLWQIFFRSVYASVTSPVPSYFILTPELIHTLEQEQTDKLSSGISNKLENPSDSWLSDYKLNNGNSNSITSYTISIPKLNITNAIVSTEDFELSKHLVQYAQTPIPPLQGNAVIFGHSTLPQLFEPNNYKTIFAHAHDLKIGDNIIIHLGDDDFKYEVIKTFITEPDDLSVLNQEPKGVYLTIVTCTPPGTTWKRLIIKARLVNS